MDIPKKVLMVAYNFPPWGGGSTIRIAKFGKYLQRLGWEVHALTIDSPYIDPDAPLDNDFLKQVEGCQIYKTKSLEPKSDTKQAIRRQSGINTDGTSMRPVSAFGKGLAFLRKRIEPYLLIPDHTVLWTPYAVCAARRIVKQEGIKLLFANCPPYGNLQTGWLIARSAGLKLVVDIKDVRSQSPIFHRLPPIRQKIEFMLEKRILRDASKTILVSQEAYDLYCARYPKLKDRFELIRNGLDIEDFQNVDRFSEKTFRIMVPGLLDSTRNPDIVVRVFSKLIEQNAFQSPVEMLFIGEIHPAFIDDAQKRLGDHLKFIPHVNHKEFIRTMSKSSGIVVISSKGVTSMIPGKLYEAIASRRPFLLLSEDGAAESLCKKYNCGETASFENEDAVLSFFQDAYEKFKNDSTVQLQPKAALDAFSREHQAEQLDELLMNVLKGQ